MAKAESSPSSGQPEEVYAEIADWLASKPLSSASFTLFQKYIDALRIQSTKRLKILETASGTIPPPEPQNVTAQIFMDELDERDKPTLDNPAEENAFLEFQDRFGNRLLPGITRGVNLLISKVSIDQIQREAQRRLEIADELARLKDRRIQQSGKNKK